MNQDSISLCAGAAKLKKEKRKRQGKIRGMTLSFQAAVGAHYRVGQGD